MSRIKQLYSRIAPASKRQMKKIIEELQSLNSSLVQENQLLQAILEKNIDTMKKEISIARTEIGDVRDKIDEVETNLIRLKDKLYVTEKHSYHAFLQAQEAVWAHVWTDTTKNVEWLEHVTFSPGRWAVGYQYLYVLYRALTEVHPNSVLELGLGQSTRLIGQFAARQPDVEHIVVEHDESWIKFFTDTNPLGASTRIAKAELITAPYLDDDQVVMYKDFEEMMEGKKFNLVSIDAPFGGNAKKYARVDLLKIMPDCLDKSFMIMIDDYNRPGEKETVRKIEEVLNLAGISYSKGMYCGVKETAVITSSDWAFLCTL